MSESASEGQNKQMPISISQEAEYTALLNAVKNYEERIKEIEGSIYWKTYLFFTKTKLILTSDSYLKSDKWRFFQRIRFLLSKPGLLLIKKFIQQLFSLLFGRVNNMINFRKGENNIEYKLYKEKKFPRASDLVAMKENLRNFTLKPFLEIFVMVNNDNFRHLNDFLNAIEKQVYTRFNVCFLVHSDSDLINYTLKKVISHDEKYRSVEYNTRAIKATEIHGDYVIFTNLNCIPAPNCFYQFINEINIRKEVCFVYSDNDFINPEQPNITENPYFKPDWSPHTLLSRNYIGNLFMVSKKIWQDIDQDLIDNTFGLVLNLTKKSKIIGHIPSILYHEHPEIINFKRILDNHNTLNKYLADHYIDAYAKLSEESLGCFEPIFPIKGKPLISIIIPCRNKATVLETCLKSIFEKSTYHNFEIIIIDNGSNEKSFFSTVAQWEYNYPEKVRSYKIDIPFNYSILNNKAVEHAKGEYLLFLNNDTKLISENLFEELLQIAQLENVGLVGPKLLYPNNTLQHAGIVLSLEEAGAHIYSGAHKDTAGYFNNTNCLTNYSAVTGACMMIKKDRFDEIKGFDENLAIDCNDVELCCELLSAGYYNVYMPWVKMYHHECLTRGNPIISNKSMIRQNNEKNYFISKRGDLINNDPFYNINLSRSSKVFEISND